MVAEPKRKQDWVGGNVAYSSIRKGNYRECEEEGMSTEWICMFDKLMVWQKRATESI